MNIGIVGAFMQTVNQTSYMIVIHTFAYNHLGLMVYYKKLLKGRQILHPS